MPNVTEIITAPVKVAGGLVSMPVKVAGGLVNKLRGGESDGLNDPALKAKV